MATKRKKTRVETGTTRAELLEAARRAALKQTGKTYRFPERVKRTPTEQQEGVGGMSTRQATAYGIFRGGKPQVPGKPTGLAKQAAAYKAAHKRNDMSGMLAAVGGDVSKLKAVHARVYPGGSSLAKTGKTTTKTAATQTTGTRTPTAAQETASYSKRPTKTTKTLTPAERRKALLKKYGGR